MPPNSAPILAALTAVRDAVFALDYGHGSWSDLREALDLLNELVPPRPPLNSLLAGTEFEGWADGPA